VLARIIESTSKLDSTWISEATGIAAGSYPTVNLHLRAYAEVRNSADDPWAHASQAEPLRLVARLEPSVDWSLGAKARALARLKGNGMNLQAVPTAPRSRWNSACHRKRDSIETNLTIVLAALAVIHRIETTTGWSIKKFVRTSPPPPTITIHAGRTLTPSLSPTRSRRLPGNPNQDQQR
jgi:hypothetical protein